MTCHGRQFQWWKQGPSDVRRIGRPVDAEDTSAFFRRHSKDFSPHKVYRAKTWARLDEQRQLPFVDINLLPKVERDTGETLARLIEENYAELQNDLGWHEPSTPQAHWMLQSVFWLVSAKMLQDKRVPKFCEIELHDVKAVFALLAQHHGMSALRLNPRDESILSGVASRMSRLGNLSFATIESLAFVYENAMITDAIRDEFGTHRTPTYLVDYILGRLAPWIERIDVNKRRVFEPACGYAGFLGAAIRLLTELLPHDRSAASSRRAYLRSRVHGCEVDPFALEIARLSLTLADIPNRDDWDLDSGDMFETDILERQSECATILLANPPFGNFTNEEQEKYRSAGWECQYLNKAAETLRRTLPHLPTNACFGVVVPQGFLHSRNAAELRRDILSEFEVDEILLFPDKVFEFSDAESAVLIGRRRKAGRPHQILYSRVREPDAQVFRSSYFPSTQRHVPQERFLSSDECDLRLPELECLWNSLDKLPLQLCDVADVGRGFSKNPEVSKFYCDNEAEGRVPVFHRFPRGVSLHSLPPEEWADLSERNLDRVRRGLPYGESQVVFNYHPTSRGPWRLKALVDHAGHAVSASFVAVRPKSVEWTVEFFWALLNSPLANAYAYSHLSKRDNIEGAMRKLRIPDASPSQLNKITLLVQRYFTSAQSHDSPLFKKGSARSPREILLRVEAAVLGIYGLDRKTERELLDLFDGWERRGVPFKSGAYFPAHFEQSANLRELI